ncbi:hypothetical protein [Massilia horti]|uniref:Uncharacterized protein n=1 Tax=Massilia horti TaxID=2562153 RepID=A0A4Y9T1P2_9BURK|nr:hypothetical protein [Massilia horti]TFW30920.1 hypothetical protein E4O92_15190 [Massilia horti]
MRDKKDNATFDLPGFESATPPESSPPVEPKRGGSRPRRTLQKQEQLQLLEETDATGLPVWQKDPSLDDTGLPVWAPA